MENQEIAFHGLLKEGLYAPSEPTEKKNKLGHCFSPFFHLGFCTLRIDDYYLTREFVLCAFTLINVF